MTKNQTSIALFSTASLLLLIPLLAMQFTQEVNWNTLDFMVAGVLLYGTAMACDFTLRKTRNKSTALLFCGGILFLLAVIWVELAVGIFH